MRATIKLAGTSLTLLLAGCSGGARLASVPAECTATNTIAVEYEAGRRMEVSRECVSVAGDTEIIVTFSPTPRLNQARTKFRGLGNWWLDAKNDDPAHPERIVVPVPSNDDGPTWYKYDIIIKRVGRIDPRIVIQ